MVQLLTSRYTLANAKKQDLSVDFANNSCNIYHKAEIPQGEDGNIGRNKMEIKKNEL